MPKTRHLLHQEITYSFARREEVNILHRLGYPDQRAKFFSLLHNNRDWIKAIIAHHLRLPSNDACHVADVAEWLHGSFNVCIPVTIDDWKDKAQPGNRVLIRFPLPYRVGDAFRPGNGDEKVRCEAGTYAWLQENCPDVPIPRLYGFATSTGETFTHLENLPIIHRSFQYLRRLLLSCLGRPIPSRYVYHQPNMRIHPGDLQTGYLLMEFVEKTTGQMLSNTWIERHSDGKLRTTFFRDLSRILLSVARIPLPRIGSFVIDKSGCLQLTNRPLSLKIQDLENEQIPTGIPRDYTYSAIQSYVMDTLHAHNNRLIHQPNAINNTGDYIYQTSALTGMQTVLPSFFTHELSRGPFVFTLTDLHQSNIFVDDEWHITSVVDLEWVCSQPIEMIRPPTWLTNKACDEIAQDADEYDQARSEFMDILKEEESKFHDTLLSTGQTPCNPPLSAMMRRSWQSGTFWYSLALASPTGLFAIFYKQIQPRFIKFCKGHDEFQQIMPWYWSQDFVRIGATKKADREKYEIRLKEAFEDEPTEKPKAT